MRDQKTCSIGWSIRRVEKIYVYTGELPQQSNTSSPTYRLNTKVRRRQEGIDEGLAVDE